MPWWKHHKYSGCLNIYLLFPYLHLNGKKKKKIMDPLLSGIGYITWYSFMFNCYTSLTWHFYNSWLRSLYLRTYSSINQRRLNCLLFLSHYCTEVWNFFSLFVYTCTIRLIYVLLENYLPCLNCNLLHEKNPYWVLTNWKQKQQNLNWKRDYLRSMLIEDFF